MQWRFLLFVALGGAALLPHAARADEEIDRLRRQLEDVQRANEALERRVDALAARTAPRSGASNPDVSLVLQGRYARLSQDPATYAIGGFIPSGGETGAGPRGFSLAESEIFLNANADPYFGGVLAAALLPEGGVSVENAYIHTLGLPGGLMLKAGRFFSKLGYQNERHQHDWDFIDAPLPYRAFLGGQLGDEGVQVKWVAPTEIFIELGGEAGRGRAFPGSDRDWNGSGLGVLFAHAGDDVGESHSWRAGLSYVSASPRGRAYDDVNSAGTTVRNEFSGTSRLWVADFVWKWAPHGDPANQNFKFQAEYFSRKEEGTLTYDTAAAANPAGPSPGAYGSRQSGWYAQVIYQFMRGWRAGLRADRLDSGSASIAQVASGALAAADFALLRPYNASLYAAMIDWSPSEFSRIRLQLAQDRSRPDVRDDQVFVQYIVMFGAHPGHLW